MESASTCLEALVGLVWFDVGLFMTADRIEGFHSWCGWPSDDRRSASRLQIHALPSSSLPSCPGTRFARIGRVITYVLL